jgi:hypothetical protein
VRAWHSNLLRTIPATRWTFRRSRLSRNSPIFPLWSIPRMARVAATRCLRWPGLLSQPERTDCWLRFTRILRKAISDGAQTLFPEQFEKLMKELGQIAPVLGRTI